MKTLTRIGWTFGMMIILLSSTVTSNAQVTPTVKEKYIIVDLFTGETLNVYYDTVTWRTINRAGNVPVDYYIIRYADNAASPDTIHGITGLVVNDLIWKNETGKWMLNEARVKWDGNELKMKDMYGRKVKWEKGVLKIKDWNSKYKSDHSDDPKYKEQWDKIKWKEGEIKVETGTQKTKVQH